MIFIGHDWAEAHHDIEVQDEAGSLLARRRFPEGLEGVAAFHALVAEQVGDADEVVVGTETDRGLWVASVIAAGYHVFAINPKAVSRYRDRHSMAGAKSDAGDAKVLADLVRTDRHNHRQVAGDSEQVEAVKVLARLHQRLIWDRQRQVNVLRSALREFYPAALVAFGTELAHSDALAVLCKAPTPARGRALGITSIESALRRGGRRRYVASRAAEIKDALRSPQLSPPTVLADAYGGAVRCAVEVLVAFNLQIAAAEAQLDLAFAAHPAADIVRSLPGLAVVLGARVLGEFGDDRTRYSDARSRRCYAGTAPITRASGTKRVVLARFVRNQRLGDACYKWAFSSLSGSPGARRFYLRRRARGDSHAQALRVLGNRLVGILDGCLRHNTPYDEHQAWGHRVQLDSAA
ncbi:MAG: IS110 family transposase [Actinomycetota bacterium]|nr:IS110 family transposase [Actinomycetota bacterium]